MFEVHRDTAMNFHKIQDPRMTSTTESAATEEGQTRRSKMTRRSDRRLEQMGSLTYSEKVLVGAESDVLVASLPVCAVFVVRRDHFARFEFSNI